MANLAKKFVGIGDRALDVFSLTCLRATRQTKIRAFGADEDEKKKFFVDCLKRRSTAPATTLTTPATADANADVDALERKER